MIIANTQAWLEMAVIGLNLCPFAKAVHVKNQIRYCVSDADSTSELLVILQTEMEFLRATSPEVIDTTLIIHPKVLTAFLDYNEFLDKADKALANLGFEGELQIASFHPQYQFAGTNSDDIENYTNRSPYPMLHLLREASVSKAIDSYPHAETIPDKNSETLRALGHSGWQKIKIPRSSLKKLP